MMTKKIKLKIKSDSLKQKMRNIFHDEIGYQFVESIDSKEAIDELDLIIYDSEFYRLNSANLIEHDKKKYNKTLRIMLSSDKNEDCLSLISENSFHEIIKEEYDEKTIKELIENKIKLRNSIYSSSVKELVLNIKDLPQKPQVVLQLQNELNSEAVSTKRVSEIIKKDPALTAKILHIVNSPYININRSISNIEEATGLLGINIIRSLAIFIIVNKHLNNNKEVQLVMDTIWTHSLRVADLTKQLMSKKIDDVKQLEVAYIVGLLHDIGQFVMLGIKNYIKDIEKTTIDKRLSRHEAEMELYGVTHAEVGAYLLELWDLPSYIVEPIAFHHYPSNIESSSFNILSALHIADVMEDMPLLDQNYLEMINYGNNLFELMEFSKNKV